MENNQNQSKPDDSELPSPEGLSSSALFTSVAAFLTELRKRGNRVTCSSYIDGLEPDEGGCTWTQMLIDIEPGTLSLHTPEDLAPFDAKDQADTHHE